MNIYQKISAVMGDVQYLCKDDKVEFNNTKYKAISEEKVTSTVRQSLIKHGLIIIPIEQQHARDGNLTTVNVKYRIFDIDDGDSSNEYIDVVSSGTGADTQDKGVGKAMTYAYKYMLLRTFAIPTGEDPDKISSEELDDIEKNTKSNAETADAITKYATPEMLKKAEDAGIDIVRLAAFQKTEPDKLTHEQIEKAIALKKKTAENAKDTTHS